MENQADILILLYVSVRFDYGLIRYVNEFFVIKTKCRLIFFFYNKFNNVTIYK